MFLTDNLEKPVLYDPALSQGECCDTLNIVTGFTDCDMISQHLIQYLINLPLQEKVTLLRWIMLMLRME